MNYRCITPEIPTTDPRMRAALDGWLGIYEGLYLIHLHCDGRNRPMTQEVKAPRSVARVAEGELPYGSQAEYMPRPEHIWRALKGGAQALNAAGVYYVVGGGLAASFLGQHRATQDVDFFLLADKDGLEPVFEALARHDLMRHPFERPSFMPPDAHFWWVPLQFGLPDAPPVNVDLLVAEHEFMAMLHATGWETEFDGVRIRVLGPEGLIVLKLQAFRHKDKWDLQEVLKANPNLDRQRLDAWVGKFKLEERLAQMERELREQGGRRYG